MLRYGTRLVIALVLSLSFFNAQAQTVQTTVETVPVTTTTPITTTTPVITTSTPAVTTTQRQVIMTTVPAPKEVVTVPAGYTSCFTVAAGWFNDVWVPEHQVCQYASSSQGVAWVSGYWACTKYTDGNCTNWDWRPGRWVKSFEVF